MATGCTPPYAFSGPAEGCDCCGCCLPPCCPTVEAEFSYGPAPAEEAESCSCDTCEGISELGAGEYNFENVELGCADGDGCALYTLYTNHIICMKPGKTYGISITAASGDGFTLPSVGCGGTDQTCLFVYDEAGECEQDVTERASDCSPLDVEGVITFADLSVTGIENATESCQKLFVRYAIEYGTGDETSCVLTPTVNYTLAITEEPPDEPIEPDCDTDCFMLMEDESNIVLEDDDGFFLMEVSDCEPVTGNVTVTAAATEEQGICCIEYLDSGNTMRVVGNGFIVATPSNTQGVLATVGGCVGGMPREWTVTLGAISGPGCCSDYGGGTTRMSYAGAGLWQGQSTMACDGIVTHSLYVDGGDSLWTYRLNFDSKGQQIVWKWLMWNCCDVNEGVSPHGSSTGDCIGTTATVAPAPAVSCDSEGPCGAFITTINGEITPLWVLDGTVIEIGLSSENPECCACTMESTRNPCEPAFRIASLRGGNRIMLNRRLLIQKVHAIRRQKLKQRLRSSRA